MTRTHEGRTVPNAQSAMRKHIRKEDTMKKGPYLLVLCLSVVIIAALVTTACGATGTTGGREWPEHITLGGHTPTDHNYMQYAGLSHMIERYLKIVFSDRA